MFVFDKQMISVRLSEQSQTDFNEFLAQYQQNFNCEFTTIKEFFDHLTTNKALFENTTPVDDEKEVIEVNSIKDELKAYADREQLPLTSTSVNIVLHALAEKEPIEETAEEETETDEAGLFITLDDEQLAALELVNQNRNSALEKQNHETRETLQDTAKGLMFNAATLNNWSGEFFTGISE